MYFVETRNVRFSSLQSEFFYYSVHGTNRTNNETLNQVKENFISIMQQLEQSGWTGVCQNTTECNVENVDVTFGPTTGRKKRSVAHKDNDILKRSTIEIRVSFHVKTNWQNFTSPDQTFSEMEAVQTRIVDVIKVSASNGDLDISGLSVDLNSFSSDLSEPNCPDGTTIKWNSLTCGEAIVSKILQRNYNSVNIWIMYPVV